MNKYFKSHRNIDNEKRNRNALEMLISLANEKTAGKDPSQIKQIAQEYAKLLGENTLDAAEESPAAFELLRTHIVSRIESIIDASGQLVDEIPLWEIRGIWEIVLRPIGVTYKSGGRDYFAVRFLFRGHYEYPRESLEKDKELIDARLTELVLSLDLKPSRFRKCQECGVYFYQPTSREKNYCSSGCAAKVRKRRFIDRKKEKGVIHQETQKE